MRFAYATGSRPLDGYAIKRGVGIGGFGEVYFAVSDAGKEVALKRIQRNLDVEIRGVSHCLNLKHPNLVAIHDIRYDDEGQAWVVMEFVRGESLKDVIERNPNGMPLNEVADWFHGICAGVAYLHDHGIVHRDLKPGNVFLDESIVKIGDYGLSKYISCSRRSGQTESVGTFHYMAPEIGRGVYGKEIDVYALGIILYEMLTGRVPFEGESSHEIIMKHLTASPDVTPIPELLRPVVQRALFKDPEKRYRNVNEILSAVMRAVGQPVGVGYIARVAGAAVQAADAVAASPLFIGREAEEGMYFGPVKQLGGTPPGAASPLRTGAPHGAPPPGPAAGRSALPPGLSDEPVARALRRLVHSMISWWRSPVLTPPARLVLAVVCVLLFVLNIGWVLPAAIVLGSLYLVYFGLRAIVLALTEPPVPVTTPFRTPPPQASPAPVGARAVPVATYATAPVQLVAVEEPGRAGARRRRRWQEVACMKLQRRPAGERLMELTGSMLLSAFVIGVATYLFLIVAGMPVDESVASWTRYAWLSLTALAGTWSLLILAKGWEGKPEDAVRRRFAQLLVGLCVGCAAFAAQQYLDVSLAVPRTFDTPRVWKPSGELFAADGTPRLPGCLVYFAGLFLIVRWWVQIDPLRNHRFSVGATLGAVLMVLIWQIFWPYPQPWGLLVAATMSIALQVSSPWVNTQTRAELRKLAEA